MLVSVITGIILIFILYAVIRWSPRYWWLLLLADVSCRSVPSHDLPPGRW